MSTDAADRMVRSMQRMLQTKGYAASGLIELVAESGAPKGSIYHHFPGGKEQIAAAAIRASGSEAAVATARAMAGAPSAVAGLRGMLTWLAEQLEISSYRYGCPIATTTLEMAAESDVVQAACADAYAAWTAAIADGLAAGGASRRAALRSATLVLAATEGALVLCRARRSKQPLSVLAASLHGMLATGDRTVARRRRPPATTSPP